MFAFTHVEYNTLQHCNNKKMKSASIISSHVIPNMKTVQHVIHDSEINNNRKNQQYGEENYHDVHDHFLCCWSFKEE